MRRGSDLRVKVKLTLEEIANGVEKKIKVKKYVNCPQCQGTGAAPNTSPITCSTCHGSEQVTQVRQTILIGRTAETLNFQRYQHMNQTDAMAGFAIGFVAVVILSLFFWGLKSLIDFLHIRKHGCPHPGLTKWWNL